MKYEVHATRRAMLFASIHENGFRFTCKLAVEKKDFRFGKIKAFRTKREAVTFANHIQSLCAYNFGKLGLPNQVERIDVIAA